MAWIQKTNANGPYWWNTDFDKPDWDPYTEVTWPDGSQGTARRYNGPDENGDPTWLGEGWSGGTPGAFNKILESYPADKGHMGTLTDEVLPFIAQAAAMYGGVNMLGNTLGPALSNLTGTMPPAQPPTSLAQLASTAIPGSEYTYSVTDGAGPQGGLDVSTTAVEDVATNAFGEPSADIFDVLQDQATGGGPLGDAQLAQSLGDIGPLMPPAIQPGLPGSGVGPGGLAAALPPAATAFNPSNPVGDPTYGGQGGGVGTDAGVGGIGGATTLAGGAASVGLAKQLADLLGVDESLLSGLGRAIPGLLGAYAASQSGDKLADLAGRFEGYGAPSRARYEQSMTAGFDPLSIPGYKGAVDNSMESMLHGLSTQGNPFSNPSGLIDANKRVVAGTALPAIQEFQRTNLTAGGLGSMNAAVPQLAAGAAGSDMDVWKQLAMGAANAFNPPQDNSLAGLLKQMKGSGIFGIPG